METNLYCCTRTGRTISEKTMEDGNAGNTKEDKIIHGSLVNLYSERPGKLTANGHDLAGEPSSLSESAREQRRPSGDAHDDKCRKRINPLRIHLGKRPFVDNSNSYSACKKKKQFVSRPSDPSAAKSAPPRVPKLIPKRVDRNQFHNAPLHVDNEQDKPVPRLVPKSQLQQFKKGKIEKGAQLKEYAQSLGLQPMVKFKCRKCCSMSFKTLTMLKEHQLVCRAQVKEPALSPEAAPSTDTGSGTSRVTRKVYLCSACGTYYENWNLFLHMREVHNRHICLFCLGMFSKAEKLSSHLMNKHNVQEFNYASKEEFCKIYNGTLYLMCCSCDEICSEQDDFFNHDCNNVKPKPVPVLVSKNTVKPNNVKLNKNTLEHTTNGPSVKIKDIPRSVSDKKDKCEVKPETYVSNPQKSLHTPNFEPNNGVCMSSEPSTVTSNFRINTTNIKEPEHSAELDSHTRKINASPEVNLNLNLSQNSSNLPNGDESLDHSEDSDSPEPDIPSPPIESIAVKSDKPSSPAPVEKEGGIKLKLSLNKANSPVIINSTVDPTVGQQYANKPPTRTRRPPKRYEKVSPIEPVKAQVKPPSIKMTICDKADSPFVKTTIFENNKEMTVKTLINNNLESETSPTGMKSENIIKTTIYDNKMEEINTLNRVPKLTVRVPKEFLDKDSSSDYSSDSDVSDKLTVDDNKPDTTIDETDSVKEEAIPEQLPHPSLPCEDSSQEEEEIKAAPKQETEEKVQIPEDNIEPKPELKTEPPELDTSAELNVEDPAAPEDCDIPITELTLDRPLDKYPLKDLLKVFLASTVFNCIYCNHVRKIAVNCEQLALHMVAEHRFSATVDSITAEELMPETITAKVRAGAVELCKIYINLDTYDSVDKCGDVQYSNIFECFQCYFKTSIHKDLCLHNRKMHQKTILLCVMCKNNFYSYSELLCHLCPGTYDSDYETKFRCCFCNLDTILSSFRLMVHLRKTHHTCDVCLELCQSQARLSNHVWKHKLHHLCYRCGIAYRNKLDITNHLFWKHGTESVLCKRCLQKKWPHVYHFCTPPALFNCDECNLQFTKAVYLKVHKRFHSEEYPHACVEEGCSEKFVSKKLLNKHVEEHKKKLLPDNISEESPASNDKLSPEETKESIAVSDLVDNKPKEDSGSSEVKSEAEVEPASKKLKKKKLKDKDALLLDMNLPALNLSESDSSDESDSGVPSSIRDEKSQDKLIEKTEEIKELPDKINEPNETLPEMPLSKIENDKIEPVEEEKPDEQQILEIWDNFKKHQAKIEKQKEKTPPLVPIRKHVCESDHDYCLIPTDLNGDDDMFSIDKKKSKKSPKKRLGDLSSSSSSSSDSDSSCSCGSNCSCSSSSGSSSSSSSDSDSSDESSNEKKKTKSKKLLPNRRISNGSNVDVMGMSETPVLVPEKPEPLIAETDLDTEESETDEEFYDKNPQQMANKLNNEKKNQLMITSSAPASDGGFVSEEASRCTTPVKEEKEEEIQKPKEEPEIREKTSSSKKKSKKKKKSKSSKKHGPIKINIPKDVISKSEVDTPLPLAPNKITISLQSNTVQIPEAPKPVIPTINTSTPITSAESKRASKRRRVPNKFYGYSSDEETPPSVTAALKPQLPPKLEWRKEDLPSPVTHKPKKEVPSTIIPQRLFNYTEPIRLTTPIPDPEPPRILMNTESMESSDSDSSGEGGPEIYENSVQSPYAAPAPAAAAAAPAPAPAPTYLNSGTSSLPYAFQRPAARQAREGESVYCYCRCPYDEVSEMIACDADGCTIEWFHFECVGIMVPPKGKWYCPECRKKQSYAGIR